MDWVDIRPLEPFCVMVANFSSSDVTLAKHEVVALALQAPAKVFTVNVDPRQPPDQKHDPAGLAQVLPEDDALPRFAARVPESPAMRERVTVYDVHWTTYPTTNSAKCAICFMNSKTYGRVSWEP